MKKLKNVLLFMSLSIVFACSDASDEDLGTTGEGSLTAKVDGTAFASLQVSAGAVVTNGVAAIQGSTSDGTYIRINIANYNGKGTYTIGTSLTDATSLTYGTLKPTIAAWIASSLIPNSSGTIEITDDTDSSVSGTFSFTGYNGSDKKVITEGKFNVPKN